MDGSAWIALAAALAGALVGGFASTMGAPRLEFGWVGLWRKTTVAPDESPSSRPPDSPRRSGPTSAVSDRTGIGPQYGGDSPYQARMRLHQSWNRSEVLCAPYGPGPTRTSSTFYGSMLDAEPAAQGKNFLNPHIHQFYLRRVADGDPNISRFRCEHNMLASQPMCFNLFAPLAADLDLATRCLQALLPDQVTRVHTVAIEHTPTPKDEYLGDGTSFDALLGYTDAAGQRAFLGVETKLAEPTAEKAYDKPRYQELTQADDSPWKPGAERALGKSPFNQLWRNHLLVEAVRRHPDSPHGRKGQFMLGWHPADQERTKVVHAYQQHLLSPADSFVAAPLDRILHAWATVARTDEEHQWVYHLNLRYLDLRASRQAAPASDDA